MTRRDWLVSSAALTAIAPVAALQGSGRSRKSEYLVLVTADGLRWQDLFTGIDRQLMKDKTVGMGEAQTLRDNLWRSSADERRKVLLPFFWGKLAPEGVVLGNLAKGSSVQVTNRYRISYPGYSEILTGRSQDDVIKSNDPIQNVTPSFLQFLQGKWKLPKEKVAVFSSWDVVAKASETKPGELYVNAGYADSTLPAGVARVAELNRLQKQARYIEDSARHDAFTFGLAMEYLKGIQPRLLYIAFDETDDWAHDKRYDRTLESIQFLDSALEELWNWLQNSSVYGGRTTLIVTTDHGRGGTATDWSDHGPKIPGDDQIWVAFIGPDTPSTGEARNVESCYQRDIAPTALALLGVDYTSYPGVLGKPIGAAIKRL